MKLLIDTNILIDIRRSKNDKEAQKRYKELLYSHEIYIPGVVIAELLHGAVSEENKRSLHRSLSIYTELNLGNGDWKVLGDQLCEYRINGLTIPLADAIIASISMKYGYTIWTEDGHFKLLKKIFPNLLVCNTAELVSEQHPDKK